MVELSFEISQEKAKVERFLNVRTINTRTLTPYNQSLLSTRTATVINITRSYYLANTSFKESNPAY